MDDSAPGPYDFTLQTDGDDVYRARLNGFGGQTLACATLAAARSCEGRALHALQACFVHAVRPGEDASLTVERIADGRRFARRRVEIRRHDKLCFHALASFASPADGPDFEEPGPLDAPLPETLRSDVEIAREEGWSEHGEDPLEWRWVGTPWKVDGPCDSSSYQAWVRLRHGDEGDAARRYAWIALLADVHSHWPFARRLGDHFDTAGFTSLDQHLWLHRDQAWDDWWLLSSVSDVAHGGRSLGRRTLRTREGRWIASMSQESMVPGATLRG